MNKNLKKIFATFAILAISCSALVACNNDKPVDPKPDDPIVDPVPQAKISYQFLGNYDELISHGMVYDFCANLLPDGVATIAIYRTNDDFTTIEGTWKEAKDEDGINVLTIRDGVNPDGKYELYAEADGSYVWKDYYFTFMGGYSRKIDMNGSSTISYEEESDWLAYVATRRANFDIPQLGGGEKEEEKNDEPTTPAEPETPSEATEVASFKSGESSVLTFMSDGTCSLSAFGQTPSVFNYTYENGVLTFSGNDSCPCEIDGGNLNFTVFSAYHVAFENLDLSVLAK